MDLQVQMHRGSQLTLRALPEAAQNMGPAPRAKARKQGPAAWPRPSAPPHRRPPENRYPGMACRRSRRSILQVARTHPIVDFPRSAGRAPTKARPGATAEHRLRGVQRMRLHLGTTGARNGHLDSYAKGMAKVGSRERYAPGDPPCLVQIGSALAAMPSGFVLDVPPYLGNMTAGVSRTTRRNPRSGRSINKQRRYAPALYPARHTQTEVRAKTRAVGRTANRVSAVFRSSRSASGIVPCKLAFLVPEGLAARVHGGARAWLVPADCPCVSKLVPVLYMRPEQPRRVQDRDLGVALGAERDCAW